MRPEILDQNKANLKFKATGTFEFEQVVDRTHGIQMSIPDAAPKEQKLLGEANPEAEKQKDILKTWGIREVPEDTRRTIERAADRVGKTITQFMNEDVKDFALERLNLPVENVTTELKKLNDRLTIFYGELTDCKNLAFDQQQEFDLELRSELLASFADLKEASSTVRIELSNFEGNQSRVIDQRFNETHSFDLALRSDLLAALKELKGEISTVKAELVEIKATQNKKPSLVGRLLGR